MFKRLLLLTLVFCSLFVLTRQKSASLLAGNQNQKNIFVSQVSTGTVLGDKTDNEPVFAALPSFDQQMKTSIKIDDARPEIVRQYLAKYNSPLEPLAQLIVDLSDQHDFDYRWMVAIAQQESNLCKRIPPDSHNC